MLSWHLQEMDTEQSGCPEGGTAATRGWNRAFDIGMVRKGEARAKGIAIQAEGTACAKLQDRKLSAYEGLRSREGNENEEVHGSFLLAGSTGGLSLSWEPLKSVSNEG